ncbi:MAG: alpha/beta hydrolase fold domain-containing protein [Candidatus Obscuribacterales bacterium]
MSAQAAESMKDIPYVAKGTVHQKLDIFVPPNVVSPPLILYIHGGGWLTGDKSDVPPFFMQTGYAIATINMRPTSVARWPAQWDDCVSALTFLRENAAKYGYSADNIIVCGISSGAHLAALMSTKDYPGKEAVKCVIDVSGPVNLLSIVAHVNHASPGQVVFASPKGQIAALIGGPPLKNQSAALNASAVTYANEHSKPVLIIHGGVDEIIPYEQANEFHRRLDAKGVKNDLVILPTAAHNMPAQMWAPAFQLFVSRYVPPPKRINVAQKVVAPPRPVQPPPPPPSSPWLPHTLQNQNVTPSADPARPQPVPGVQGQQPTGVPQSQPPSQVSPGSQAQPAGPGQPQTNNAGQSPNHARSQSQSSAQNQPETGFRARHQQRLQQLQQQRVQ